MDYTLIDWVSQVGFGQFVRSMDERRVRWLGRVHTVPMSTVSLLISKAVGGNRKNKEWTVDHSINVEVWLRIDIGDTLDKANIKPFFPSFDEKPIL